jgi:hypothetical protein
MKTKHYRGLWRIQEKAPGDNRLRKGSPDEKLPSTSTVVQGPTVPAGIDLSHDEELIELTSRLTNIVNLSSEDIRAMPPIRLWKIINTTTLQTLCIVISLSGDLKRDRIKGVTLPLYTHRSKL